MKERSGRLAFVGLGLYDEQGITIRGLRELEQAEFAFAEAYTSSLKPGTIERLARQTKKEISVIGRREVEDASAILDRADGSRVVLLTAGDPMAATTHIDLRLRASRKGIETEVINGVSALTAVPGALGLQQYKFGRTTTVPFPAEGYSPTSPYEIVLENISRGLHTLVLLDIDAENTNYMTANQGMHLLVDMERRVGSGILTEQSLMCVVARAGHPDCVARAGNMAELMLLDFGSPLHSIVVPGKLHFMEEEALREFAGWKGADRD